MDEKSIYMNHGEVVELQERPAEDLGGTLFVIKFILEHGSGLNEEMANNILGRTVRFAMYECADTIKRADGGKAWLS